MIENALGSAEADILIGNEQGNQLKGGDGNDVIFGDEVVARWAAPGGDLNGFWFDPWQDDPYQLPGSASDNDKDLIDAGAGVDYVFAGQGDDSVVGGAGNDFLDGSAGTDSAAYADVSGTIHVRQLVSSKVPEGVPVTQARVFQVSLTRDNEAEVDLIRDFEILKLGHGNDSVLAEGSFGGQSIVGLDGGSAPLLVDADAGNDLLVGKESIIFLGGDGADYLLADSGNVTLDGGAGNDYLEATGDEPVTYVFGRGSGHDVLASFYPAWHNMDYPIWEPWPLEEPNWVSNWAEQRHQDVIRLDDLFPSDLILEWDYEEYIYSGSEWTYTVRRGDAAIKIVSTGDTLYLRNLCFASWSWPSLGHEEGHLILGSNVVEPGWLEGSQQWHRTYDMRLFQTADGVQRDLMELFDFRTLSNIVKTKLSPEYSSALAEFRGGGTGVSVSSDAGSFEIVGSEADEVLGGSDGDDVVIGGNGDDVLIDGPGNDILLGASGDDTLVGSGQGSDHFNGGAGTDQVTFTNSQGGVVVDLSVGVASIDGNKQIALSGIESVLTGSASDILIGSHLSNTLEGGAGNDTLIGGLGPDLLTGGAGLDSTSYAGSSSGVMINLRSGNGHGGDAEGDRLIEIETVVGSAFADQLTGDEFANGLDGGDGNDLLIGGLGGDTLIGGAGDDTYEIDSAGDVIVEWAGEGFDTVRSAIGLTLGSGLVVLVLTGEGALSATGNAAANVVTGNGSDNVLAGLGGADTLDGGDGSDTASYAASAAAVAVDLALGTASGGDAEGDALLRVENLEGSAFADTLAGDAEANALSGGAGDDTLAGRAGDDVLTGGAGSDTFVFDTGFGADTIADFTAGAGTEDVIQFARAVFADFAAVQAAASQSGGDVVIAAGAGETVTLKSTTVAALHADDFRFV
jgi:Ca2+-binding RTX toxin-like protein